MNFGFNNAPTNTPAMSIILFNFKGIRDTVSHLSKCSDPSAVDVSEEMRRRRVFMTPSRFSRFSKGNTCADFDLSFARSADLCAEVKNAISTYFGSERLDEVSKLIDKDIMRCFILEYISTLRKLNYDVGVGDVLLNKTLRTVAPPPVMARSVKVISSKII